ncbi:hypothetical protein HDN1F_20310 [gamma proteobacterium HdN1]|nr:hypothetical protein HDN1F_20310 [gamma proteobacterium HdN1]
MFDKASVKVIDVVASEPVVGGAKPQVTTSVFDVACFEDCQRQLAAEQVNSTVTKDTVAQTGLDSARMHVDRFGFEGALRTLESLNQSGESLGMEALQATTNFRDLTPGEVLNLTVQSHHFMFKSEMTATVANKTSDGVQQLFRQQS